MEWCTAIREGITQDGIWFPCSTTSSKAVKKPRLVGFWDGSSQAFSVVIYYVTMVSKTKDNDQDTLPDGDIDERDFDPKLHRFESHILATKSRVILLKTGLMIPRSQLSGLLLCLR